MNSEGLYTVYDFINTDVQEKDMKFGWKIETKDCISSVHIVLRYTMLNFDWNSFGFLGDEGWNIFLKSKSYTTMKKKLDEDSRKFERTYFEATSISNLKELVEDIQLKTDVDKMIQSLIEKKSDQMKERNAISSNI